MIERIDDMPTGTIGFRASGKLTRDDCRNVLEPVLRPGIVRIWGPGEGPQESACARSS